MQFNLQRIITALLGGKCFQLYWYFKLSSHFDWFLWYLGDKCIDDSINIFSVSCIKQIQYLFHAAVCLFSSRLQKVSKCDKNSSASHAALTLCATFFLSYFDVTVHVIYYWTETLQRGISVLNIHLFFIGLLLWGKKGMVLCHMLDTSILYSRSVSGGL